MASVAARFCSVSRSDSRRVESALACKDAVSAKARAANAACSSEAKRARSCSILAICSVRDFSTSAALASCSSNARCASSLREMRGSSDVLHSVSSSQQRACSFSSAENAASIRSRVSASSFRRWNSSERSCLASNSVVFQRASACAATASCSLSSPWRRSHSMHRTKGESGISSKASVCVASSRCCCCCCLFASFFRASCARQTSAIDARSSSMASATLFSIVVFTLLDSPPARARVRVKGSTNLSSASSDCCFLCSPL